MSQYGQASSLLAEQSSLSALESIRQEAVYRSPYRVLRDALRFPPTGPCDETAICLSVRGKMGLSQTGECGAE